MKITKQDLMNLIKEELGEAKKDQGPINVGRELAAKAGITGMKADPKRSIWTDDTSEEAKTARQQVQEIFTSSGKKYCYYMTHKNPRAPTGTAWSDLSATENIQKDYKFLLSVGYTPRYTNSNGDVPVLNSMSEKVAGYLVKASDFAFKQDPSKSKWSTLLKTFNDVEGGSDMSDDEDDDDLEEMNISKPSMPSISTPTTPSMHENKTTFTKQYLMQVINEELKKVLSK